MTAFFRSNASSSLCSGAILGVLIDFLGLFVIWDAAVCLRLGFAAFVLGLSVVNIISKVLLEVERNRILKINSAEEYQPLKVILEITSDKLL